MDKSTLKSLAPDGIACFGIWALHVWIYWVNTHNSFLPVSVPWQSLYGTLALSTFIVACAFSQKSPSERIGRKGLVADGIVAVMMGICTLAIRLPSIGPSSLEWPVVGTLLGGACLGWAYVRWGWYYSRLSAVTSVRCLFVSAVFAVAVKTLLMFAPDEVGTLLTACLPGLSMLMLASARQGLSKAKQPATKLYGHNPIASLWKVGTVFFTFSLVMAELTWLVGPKEQADETLILISRLIELSLALTVLWWVVGKGHGIHFTRLWRFVFLYLALALALETYLPDNPYSRPVIVASADILVLFIWLTISDISHHSEDHPYTVFGFGWCAYSLPCALSALFAKLAPFEEDKTLFAFTLLLVMGVVMAVCLETRDRDTALIFADLRKESTVPKEFLSVDERCQSLGKQHGLTPREIEVMQLLCRGNSKPYIAEKLFVTESTVRGHTKHVYQKLGVHSKSELQSLVGL